MRAAPSPRAARAREDLADVRRPRDEVARRRNSSHSRLEPIVGTLQTCAWSEWHPRIWRNCSYPIWASSMQKVHSAGIQCALFYYPLSSRFSSFACSRGGSPSRAHTVTRAPRPRPTSPPAFPSARYPRFPPRARTPRPAVSPALARHVLRRRVRRAPAQPQGRPPRASLREQERDRLLQRGGAHERRVCVSIPRSARSAIAQRPRTNRASRDAPAPRHARRQTLIDLIDWDRSRRTSAVSDPAADPAPLPPGPAPPVSSHRLPRELLVLPRPHGPPPRPDDDRDGEEVLHQRRRGPAHALLGQRLGRLGAPA